MIRVVAFGLSTALSLSALGNGIAELGLSTADLERLGVVLDAPVAAAAIEVAAGPAELVIPPAQQAVVSSTVAGVLARTLVAEGDSVARGRPLAEIASAELLDAQSSYVDAAVSAGLARAQLDRDRGLFADGIIAERRLQEATARERAAAAALEQHRQQLLLAGMTDRALADLAATGTLDSNVTLTAPFDAVVIEQLASIGTRVDALDPVYRVADLSELWLEAHVPQEQAQRVALGMRVVGAAGSRNIEGTVIQIGRVVDPASQSVTVRARVTNVTHVMRAGQFMSARVLEDAPHAAAHTVPSAAIARRNDTAYAFARRDGAIFPVAVEIVAATDTHTTVRGLEADAEIAVMGVAALKSVWLTGEAEGQ